MTSTNDPLEFLSPENFGFSYWGNIDYKKVFYEFRLSGQKRRNYVRMLCFCKDLFCTSEEWKNEKNQDFADNLLFKGWARSRMWAQYADNHSGACLVFYKSEFQKAFKSLSNDDVEILSDRAINYTNYLAELETSLEDINSGARVIYDYSNFYLEEDKKKFLFQKSQDYRDENKDLRTVRLAPCYDVVATRVYKNDINEMSLSINGKPNMDEVTRADFELEAKSCGLGTKPAMKIFDEVQNGLLEALKEIAVELEKKGFARAGEIADRIKRPGVIHHDNRNK